MGTDFTTSNGPSAQSTQKKSWEQEPLNCVGYITSTQAGRAPLQLAQSKAGWINWSGSCANEVRSLLSPLVLLGQIIWAHLSWWISGCEWNGLVECHCAFTPLTSMTPSRRDEGAAPHWEKLWQLYLSLANGHSLLSSCIPWWVILIHSSGGFHISLLTRWLEHGLIVSILKDFCLLRHETKATPVMSSLKANLLIWTELETCLMMLLIIIQTHRRWERLFFDSGFSKEQNTCMLVDGTTGLTSFLLPNDDN